MFAVLCNQKLVVGNDTDVFNCGIFKNGSPIFIKDVPTAAGFAYNSKAIISKAEGLSEAKPAESLLSISLDIAFLIVIVFHMGIARE